MKATKMNKVKNRFFRFETGERIMQFFQQRNKTAKKPFDKRRLRMETLEDRLVLSVSSMSDDGSMIYSSQLSSNQKDEESIQQDINNSDLANGRDNVESWGDLTQGSQENFIENRDNYHEIFTMTSVDNTNNNIVTPSSGAYSGVCKITSGGYYGTGSLLSTGRHILTAAHVVINTSTGNVNSSTTVTFDLPNGQQKVISISASQIILHPNFALPAQGGSRADTPDLAIIILSEEMPAEIVERYDIYRGSGEMNQVVTKVGYGKYGTGYQGDVHEGGTDKRYGENKYEAYYSTNNQNVIACDFDGGGRNVFGDSGQGAMEVCVVRGDSGGPGFIGPNNLIAGVSSFGLCQNEPPLPEGIFGDMFLDVRVSSYADWIDGILHVGDTIATASNIHIGTNGVYSITETISNSSGLGTTKDVDMYKIVVSASDVGKRFAITTSRPAFGPNVLPSISGPYPIGYQHPVLNTHIRLFNSSGTELQNNNNITALSGMTDSYLTFTPTAAGTYYLGVSSYANRNYSPTVSSSGPGGEPGYYTLTITKSNTNLPEAPFLKGTLSIYGSGFTINWNTVSGATSYVLENSSNGFSNWSNAYSGSGTSYFNGSGTIGSTYYYRIKATNASGSSMYSPVLALNLTLPPLFPPLFSPNQNSGSSIFEDLKLVNQSLYFDTYYKNNGLQSGIDSSISAIADELSVADMFGKSAIGSVSNGITQIMDQSLSHFLDDELQMDISLSALNG